ncbi:MAG TPA: NAD(P)-binding protein, partial [Saprospiraceae bacterium]|nr:NAD(P)-binding protein [Saprospiraceae bacterium]
MNKPKTSLLRSLIRRYQQASLIEKNPALDVDTILELERTDPYSRRKFIKDSAKALTIIGLSSVIPFVSCRTKTDHEPPKLIKDKPERNNPVIVIIGGGIAGLNCAYQLKKKNIIAHVYEADKKTGGRISSKENELGPGLITEYGGEFIDTNNLDIINLVKELNLLMYDTHADIKDNHLIKEDYYFKNKKRSDKDILNEFKKIVKKLEGDKIKCRTDYTSKDAIIFDNTSLEEYV